MNLQPMLSGNLVELRPLTENDFEALFAIASDPFIWEQHPVKNRFERHVYQKLFKEFTESKDTLVIRDTVTKSIIGSSRYYDYDQSSKSIAIGFTMLSRQYWGGRYNTDLKKVMIEHAFKHVDQIIFHVGECNLRSQKAVEKIGGKRFEQSIKQLPDGQEFISLHFRILRSEWQF